MKNLIVIISIIITLYLCFFGCDKYNFKPFIVNWFKSDSPAQLKEKANKIKDIIVEKGKNEVKEQTDSIINDFSDRN